MVAIGRGHLIERARVLASKLVGTGRGQLVETSLYQGVLAFTTMLWVHAERNQSQAQTVMTKTYPPGVHQAEVMESADGWVQVLPGSGRKKGATIHQIFDVPAMPKS